MSKLKSWCCLLLILLLLWTVAPATSLAIPPLHEAARDGKIDDIRRMIADNPNIVDERDEYGNSAIHWAVNTGQVVVVQYLLEHGVSPNVAKTDAARNQSQIGYTPLHQAAEDGQVECAKIILRYRPNLLARDQNDQTPLHTATWHNRIDMAKLLLDAGTPVNVTRKDKVIPLEIASYFGHMDMLKMLIERGGDVNWHVYEGYTPLMQAIRSGHPDVMQVLVEHGADIEARRDNGETALHVAAGNGRVWEMNFLLAMGADAEAKRTDGLTPLAVAQRTNQGGTLGVLQAFLNAHREMETLIQARRLNANDLPPAQRVKETTVYTNDFSEEAVGPEWTTITTGAFAGALKTTSIPNSGKRFLGEFGDQNIRLTLTKLPPHAQVTVVLTLFILRTWDGGGIAPGSGPDIWEASVENGPNLFRGTFSNKPDDWNHTPIQSYPGEWTYEAHPHRTGAIASNLLHLGATNDNPTGAWDGVYRMKFTFAHNKPVVMLNFQGKNLEEVSNESWGIRTIEVRVGSVPSTTHAVAAPRTPKSKHR